MLEKIRSVRIRSILIRIQLKTKKYRIRNRGYVIGLKLTSTVLEKVCFKKIWSDHVEITGVSDPDSLSPDPDPRNL
jgi:hypothetical protein